MKKTEIIPGLAIVALACSGCLDPNKTTIEMEPTTIVKERPVKKEVAIPTAFEQHMQERLQVLQSRLEALQKKISNDPNLRGYESEARELSLRLGEMRSQLSTPAGKQEQGLSGQEIDRGVASIEQSVASLEAQLGAG